MDLGNWQTADLRPGIAINCRKQGLKKCKRQCVDLQTDPNHCGRCKGVCAAGQTCESGVCTDSTPSCSGGSQCGNPIDCGPGDAGCFCVTGTSGTTACAYDAGCTDCTQDSDCTDESGGLCEIGSCCPVGACFYARNSCVNALAQRSIFGKRTKSSFDL